MRPYDDADLSVQAEAALDAGATITVRCAAYRSGTFQGYFDVDGLTIDWDEQSTIRGRCQLSVPGNSFLDPDVFDPAVIDVDAWKVQVQAGVVLPNGTIVYAIVGTFVVWSSDREDDQTEAVTLQGLDVTALIQQSRMENVYPIAAGTNYATAISDLVTPLGIPVSLPTTNYTTPLLVFEEGTDRLENIRKMADSLGWELYADLYGGLTGRSVPTASGVPVATFVEGDGCRMQAIGKKRTRDQVYNIAIVEGQPAGVTAPVRGVAYDDDPRSPTYVTATATFDFGRAPVFFKSEFITTTDQASDAALGLLQRKRGIGSQLQIQHVRPDFRLEPADPIQVVRSRLGVDTVVPVRSTSLSLSRGSFDTTINTREVFA